MGTSFPHRRVAVIAIVAAVLLAGFGGTVVGQSGTDSLPAQTGPAGTVVVDEGQTSNGISTVAGTVVVRGTVDGDVNAVSGDVVITESGTVNGNVNGAAGSLHVAGTVAGNVDFAGGTIVFEEPARVGGNVNIGAGTVHIDGQIDGDVTAGADRIIVAPTAVLGGDLRYDGALTLQEGATVSGSVVRDNSIGGGMSSVGSAPFSSVPDWTGTLYGFFANLLLGALLLVLFPRFATDVAGTVSERPFRSGGWGALLLFGVPVALVAIAITIIGIPIALIGFLLYVFAIWLGVVVGEFAVGVSLVDRLGSGGRWQGLIVGLLVFSLLGLVPILGGIAVFFALLAGLGALGSTLWSRFRNRGTDETEPSEPSVAEADE